MLAGEPPFTAPPCRRSSRKRFSGAVPDVSQSRPSVPEHVGQAVSQALAPVAADRFSSAAGVCQGVAGRSDWRREPRARVPGVRPPPRPRAGRRVPVAVIALELGVPHRPRRVVRLAPKSSRGGREPPGRRCSAVLPFENLGAGRTPTSPTASPIDLRRKLSQVAGVTLLGPARTNTGKPRSQPAANRPRTGGEVPTHRHRAMGEARARMVSRVQGDP